MLYLFIYAALFFQKRKRQIENLTCNGLIINLKLPYLKKSNFILLVRIIVLIFKDSVPIAKMLFFNILKAICLEITIFVKVVKFKFLLTHVI